MTHALIASALTSVATGACAHDEGRQGTVWPIREPSLIETIVLRASKVDWAGVNRGLVDQTRSFMRGAPQVGLERATRTVTTYFKPSFTTQAPITGPGRQGVAANWPVLAPAGTAVNALQYVHPLTRFLVFNPDDPDQRAFAIAAQHAYPRLLELVATGGDIEAIAKKVDAPVFYAGPRFVSGLHLTQEPCVVGVGAQLHSDEVAVTTLARGDLDPAQAKDLLSRTWYGLTPQAKAQK